MPSFRSPSMRLRGRAALVGCVAALAIIASALGPLDAATAGSSPGRNGKIAFVRGGDIWTVNPDGTSARRLIVDGQAPAWAPAGRRLAFTRGPDILVADADGTHVSVVFDGPDDPFGFAGDPTWSPDGTRIAFGMFEGEPVWETNLYWIRAAAPHGAPRRLTTGSGLQSSHAYGAQWSPEGGEVAYGWKDTPGSCASTELSVRVVSLGTKAVRVLAQGQSPVWAPHARNLAFSEPFYCDGRPPINLRRVLPDGSEPKPVTTFGGPEDVARSPAWSPSGLRLAFTLTQCSFRFRLRRQ